jgi:hypothetical protein
MTATKLPDIFDVPDAGQSGEFALCRAGGGLYFAVIANGGDGGRLFIGPVGGQPARIDLGPLGVTGALSVRLDGHGPGGTLVAYIKRIVDTDGQDRGRRVITPVETGVAVGGGDAPVDPPAPPGGALDLSAVLQAIAAARGPQDGRDAEFNSVAGAHNGVDATYKKVVDETSAVLGVLDPLSQLAREAARAPGWLWQPPTRDYGLPHELEPFVGTDFQQYLCATVIALLEFVTRLSEFPRQDGTSILRT